MRQSSANQGSIPRRSTSADSFGASSQNRQSAGRASSVGRPSSIGIFKTIDGKPIESKDLAPVIYDELDILGYPFSEQFTVKTLLLPSTATFYSIFEFLLKTIGIQDVWSANYLVQPNQPKNPNQPISSSQPQTNSVQNNKNRIDLIIHHLNFLKFTNIPKPNILQNMTTPKHWTLMLQILYFLCNNCKFLNNFETEKVVNSLAANQDFISSYMSKTYKNVVTKGYDYLNTEEYKQNKKESLKRFEEILKGDMDIDRLNANLQNLKRTHERLNNQRNEFEDLLKEEAELKRVIDEEEATLNNLKLDYDDRLKRNAILKNECTSLKDKINQMEKERAVKDAQYERQLASGKQLGNLPVKHAQTVKELDQLQNSLLELENEKDSLYIRLNQISIDGKNSLNKANEILNKIKITSKISLDEIPLLEMVDLHKKNNMKDYKDLFTKIRKEYNEKILKLPNELSQALAGKKLIDSKIDSYKIEMKNLEKETKDMEELLNELRKTTEIALLEEVHQINIKKSDMNEAAKQFDMMKERLMGTKDELKRVKDDYKKVDIESNNTQSEMIENLENYKKERVVSLENCQKQIKSDLMKYQAPINGLIALSEHFIRTHPAKLDI